ncbi:Glycolate permease GlcA [Jannaschia seosinensis]|uniref:L-lactate permease n=2 Tax=Jannaschia seosinensis TaxID=313367 RepID=A0A0M7B6F6_9RHOB|nr:Glycolate permease GlcA [Jannaschia seosinensis]
MLSALAAAPIAAVLVLMLLGGWSAAGAGSVGAGLAIVLALAAFDPAPGAARMLMGAAAEAGFTTATILWIIWPALCIHALQTGTGRIAMLQAALERLSGDNVARTLLIGWFFALFMEGAAGFGAPVALAAPLLVSLGLPPVRALTIALIGHAAGVSFGAVGTPILPQIAATDLSGRALAVVPALLHGALGWVLMLALLREMGAWRWRLGLVAALAFFVPYVALALLFGPELPTLGGALIGGVGFALFLRIRGGAASSGGGATSPGDLAMAFAPYLTLVVLIVVARLPGLREVLANADLSWGLWERFSGTFAPLYHPGTLLAVSFLGGWALQRPAFAEVRGAIGRGTRQVLPVVPALLVMLVLARILVHAGMIDQLARDAAKAFSGIWPPIAPLVGMLGTFVTGSATTSNILFTELQARIASELNLSLLLVLGAQTFGAAVGNIVCPHNVVAGCATIGLVGREGEILRRTLPVGLLYGLLGGGLVWLLSVVGLF